VKKLLSMLLIVSMAGCMNTPKQAAKKPSAGDSDAAAVQKQLPMVDPQSITKENGVSKAQELQDELLQESKRMASARTSDGPN
jgi:hypothetical protein